MRTIKKMESSTFSFRQTRLKNGLRVVSSILPGVDSVAVGIWAATGGRYESKKDAGISHFIEHLLFKGTPSISGINIKKSIEGIGGTLNGFTSEEATCFLVKILSKRLDRAVEILSDMVQHPLFKKSDIEKEKGVITEEIKMYQDIPSYYVQERLDKMLWPNHPLGRPIAGDCKTVASLTRARLSSFKRRFYSPQNMCVVAAGAIDHADLEGMVKRIFSRTSLGSPPGFKKARSLSLKGPQVDLQCRDTEQTQIALGMRGLDREDPQRFALKLLSIILGGNMSSRLFQELREKRGLAYDVHTKTVGYHDTGAFVVSAGIEHGNLRRVIRLILRELRRIKENGVGRQELNRAKEFYTGQFLMGLEDSMSYMVWLGEMATCLKRIEEPRHILGKIEKVKIKDIKEVAEKLFKNIGLRLAVVWSLKDKREEEIERLLDEL